MKKISEKVLDSKVIKDYANKYSVEVQNSGLYEDLHSICFYVLDGENDECPISFIFDEDKETLSFESFGEVEGLANIPKTISTDVELKKMIKFISTNAR